MGKHSKILRAAYRLVVEAMQQAKAEGRWADRQFPANKGTVEFDQGMWMAIQLIEELLNGETSEEEFLEEIKELCCFKSQDETQINSKF